MAKTENADLVRSLTQLSERLRGAQRELILSAARSGQLPPENMIRRISDLENTIVAVETLIAEEK
ncbi:hypothetical protein [Chthonobacter albigriseus]|uniref:hypothetical protein n=1 Tax=Chthonobacter albigriseus TaxID=1683161 RepID=UPI0015EF9B24